MRISSRVPLSHKQKGRLLIDVQTRKYLWTTGKDGGETVIARNTKSC